jgi:hypothetical protein
MTESQLNQLLRQVALDGKELVGMIGNNTLPMESIKICLKAHQHSAISLVYCSDPGDLSDQRIKIYYPTLLGHIILDYLQVPVDLKMPFLMQNLFYFGMVDRFGSACSPSCSMGWSAVERVSLVASGCSFRICQLSGTDNVSSLFVSSSVVEGFRPKYILSPFPKTLSGFHMSESVKPS